MSRRKPKRKNHGRRTSAGTLAQRALERHIAADRLLLIRLRVAWPHMVPTSLLGRTWPSSIERGLLAVDVSDNQWLHELVYLQADLLTRIRSHMPKAPISRLRFRLGVVPPSAAAEASAPPRRGPALLAAEPSADTLAALEQVRDAGLRAAIASARVALTRP